MQTAVLNAPALTQSIARSTQTQRDPGLDPRIRRFGYHPGLWQMEMDPLSSGLQQRLIPGGELLAFETIDKKMGNFDGILKANAKSPEVTKERTAAWFIRNVISTFGTGNRDRGFRELGMLTSCDPGENGTEYEARNLFYGVHPTFQMVGHECPYELDVCPTCRVGMLKAFQGETEQEESLRQLLLAANLRYIAYAEQKYDRLIGEIDQRKAGENGISKLGEAEHYLRRQIHHARQTDVQTNLVAQIGNSQAATMREGFQELRAGVTEVIQSQQQPQDNAVQAATLKVLEKMADKLDQIIVPEPVVEPVAEPAKRGPGRPPANRTDEG